MAENFATSALHRKAGANRPPPEIPAMSARKAASIALSRAAKRAVQLDASVVEFSENNMSAQRFSRDLDEYTLILGLSGPDGARGVATLDAEATSALVSFLTTGRLGASEGESRRATGTDALIISPLIDSFLHLFEENVQEMRKPPDVGGYSVSGKMESPRNVSVVLDDIPYLAFDISLDLEQGTRGGLMRLLFPCDDKEGKLSPEAIWGNSWHKQVQASEVNLNAVLYRFTMSVDQLAELEPGDLLPIPVSSLSMVSLEGEPGENVSHGRLGQILGHRAVMLSDNSKVSGCANGSAPMLSPIQNLPAFDNSAPMGGGMPAPPMDLPPMPDMGTVPMEAAPMGVAPMGDFPPIGDMAGGDVPPMGDLPPMGDFPPMGDIPMGGGAAPMGDLPPMDFDFVPPTGEES